MPICKNCGQFVREGEICTCPYLIMRCKQCKEESEVPLDMPIVSYAVACICGAIDWEFEYPKKD